MRTVHRGRPAHTARTADTLRMLATAAGLAGLAFAGCGGSGGAGSGATGGGSGSGAGKSQTAAAASTKAATVTTRAAQPAGPLSGAQAAAFAGAVNLTAADMPGWQETKAAREKAQSGSSEQPLRKCLGVSSKQVPEYKSARFSRLGDSNSEDITSSVEIVGSAREADAEIASLRGPRALGCLRAMGPALAGNAKQLRVGRLQVSRLPTPASVPDSFALRLATTLSSKQAGRSSPTLQAFIDVYGAVSGRVELGLSAVGVGRAVPAQTSEALLAKLAQRAAAHPL